MRTMLARVPEALAQVGLAGLGARTDSRRLSGGQQQRLALAGALAPRPGAARPRRADRQPRPGGAAAFIDALGRAARRALGHDRAGRAPGRRGLAARRRRPGARTPTGARSTSGRRTRSSRARADRDADGRDLAAGGRSTVRSSMAARPAPTRPDVLEADGCAIRLRAGRARRPRRRPRRGGRRADRARRAERQRQVDARPPARRPASPGPRDRRPGRRRTRPPAAPATLARRAGYVFQEPERQFLAQTRRATRCGSGSTDDELDARRRPDGPPRPAARPVRASAARTGCPAASSAGCRSPASSSAARTCSSSTSPRSARTGRATRACSASSREHLDAGACLIAATHDERFVARRRRAGSSSSTTAGSCATRPWRDRRDGSRSRDAQLDSPLGRTSPWSSWRSPWSGSSVSRSRLQPLPPLVLAIAALVAGLVLGAHPAAGAGSQPSRPSGSRPLVVGLSQHACSPRPTATRPRPSSRVIGPSGSRTRRS